MSSAEAQSDFPDEKQRLAVAYSMFEKRNASDLYGRPEAEHPWPKKYSCSFIEPGVVFYQDLGPCKVCGEALTCGDAGDKCVAEGATVLVQQDCLAKMAQSFVGKPVIDMVHKDVTPDTVANGDAEGIITRVWLDDKSGWWMADFLVWSPEAQGHCESPSYSVSCAYEPTDVDSAGGEYHNIPYAENILNGEYTHLAIVTNPRYEGARIFVNSKGDKMSWRFWEKGARKNAAPLDPLKTMVDVDGTKVPLQNLYDAHKEEAKNKLPEEPKLNDDTVLDNDGAETTLGELKQAYRNKAKQNAEAKCKECGADKAVKNAEEHEGEGEKKALPDLRRTNEDPEAARDKPSQAEAQAKVLEKETEEKRVLELEQKKNADDSTAARDEKNAAEAAAMKNAEDKKAEDKKNAEDKEAELAEKRNAGRKAFAALRNARGEHAGEAVKINPVSIDERLAKGKSKYGSPA